MKKISITFAVAFTIIGMALMIFYFPEQKSSTIAIKTSGTIVYPKTAATTQEPSSFSLPNQLNDLPIPFNNPFCYSGLP